METSPCLLPWSTSACRPSLLARPTAERQHRQTSPGANPPTGGCSCQHRSADFHSMCVRACASTPSAARERKAELCYLTLGFTLANHRRRSHLATPAAPSAKPLKRGSLVPTNGDLPYSRQRTNHRRSLGDFFEGTSLVHCL